MTTYEIQHMRGWRRFARTVRAARRAEAERLCLPGEGGDGEVLAVIPAEAEVAEHWQRLNEDLVEGLERLRRDE
ncbi:hypothetical protein I5F78_11815 [Pseudomonas aeruginosa]|nr:hypothetical protein [Pseudomonas aeruginosa]